MRVLLAAMVIFSASGLFANEWRQFRGPGGQGNSADSRNLPTTWSETENIIWKAEIPGRGWSSPVFAGPTIWLTTAIEHPLEGADLEKVREAKLGNGPIAKQMKLFDFVTLHAIGIDAATGRVDTDIELFKVKDLEAIHSLNSFASPSPVLDGALLFCHFGELGTACVDTVIKDVVWRAHLPSKHAVGPGSSPIVHQNLFIVPCDGMDQQYVIALDKLTGAKVWKTNRPPMAGNNGDLHKSFCTPLLFNDGTRDQVIIPGAQWVVAYDPRDGSEIWKVRHGSGFSNVPRPVAGHGMAYICTGFMNPQIWAIRLDGQGDVTETHIQFKIPKQVPATPSPVLIDKQLYFITDQGVATSVDALTGDVIWTRRIPGNFSSSPLFADGKIYLSNHEGNTTVLRPGREYDEVAVNSLSGQLMASPAILGESLLLRSQSHLYRIGIQPARQ